MNQAHARYGAYKDSGVEWLSEIPARWEVTRNKDIFEERGDLSISGDETLLTVSHITGVTRRTEKNVNMFMAETMEGYKLCQTGDLIINTMWAWMGALGTANEAGICSPAYGVYRPKKHAHYNHRYFDYLYRTPHAITEMTRNSKGIVSSRLRLYPRDFFQIQTALPDEAEQTAIATYLDTKTAQLDQKIELLGQKAAQYGKLKQSIINETVNRPFDEQSHLRIRLETEAKLTIQEEIRRGTFQLVWSYILDYENGKNPFQERKEQIVKWKKYAATDIEENAEIIEAAILLNTQGLQKMDALHIACASFAKADYFLTTDDKVANKASAVTGVKIIDPIDFITRHCHDN